MRCILIILDGLGDRSHSVFSYQTPLQAAYTPNLDFLAQKGMNGLYHPYLQGVPLSSEIAHFLIFGYDLEKFPGRGYLEAKGHGIEIKKGEVVLLCHLCSVEEKDGQLIMVKKRPKVSKEEVSLIHQLIGSFEAEGINIKFIPSRNVDGFLILSGDVSEKITDSNPIYENRPLVKIKPVDPIWSAQKTASILNHYLCWVYRQLKNHPFNQRRQEKGLSPINALATQRAGCQKMLLSFFDKWGLKGLSISSGPIYWGLCKELGMEVIKVKDSNNLKADLEERLKLAYQAKEYDFIHVHTKAPDEAGHTKNPTYKQKVIEALDQAMGFAVENLAPDPEILLVVTADHSTASSGNMIHTGETVPLMMIGRYVRRDTVKAFNEIDCAQGALGLVKGKELMYLILNFLDRGKLKGLMDTPFDQPYYPGYYEPLNFNEDKNE